MLPSPNTRLASIEQAIVQALHEQGWYVGDSLFDAELTGALALRARHAVDSGLMHPAGTGRGERAATRPEWRRDQILWLDEASSDPIEAAALAHLERLRQGLNRSLLLGLQEGEFHYAHYTPGGFYRRHRDRFADDDARVVSVIAYLNPDWQEADGGALQLYTVDGTCLTRVLPQAGTMVVFLSAEFPHEVQEARRDRLSLTGWLRQHKRLI